MGASNTNAGNWTLVLKTQSVRVIRIGLTGGIGSGKSTVATMLQDLGAVIVDADAIARAITAPQGVALSGIAALFGPLFFDSAGALNREKMREIVFKDPTAKSKLENLLHPLIRQEMRAQADLACAQGATFLVFDIPLLVESGDWRNHLDFVLVVDCTPETQILRVRERNGFSSEVVRTVISAQASRKDRLQAADMVLFNDHCSLDQLASCVRAIVSKFGL